MHLSQLTFILLLFLNGGNQDSCGVNNLFQAEQNIRLMFYNTENLFDTYDDSTTLDNEFLPEGNYHWTKNRFYNKINKVYQVIAAAGEWTPPDIIGLCEIENRYVLEQLTNYTPLLKHNYKIVHKNSPDIRGIDVGLLYNPETITPITEAFIPVKNAGNKEFRTRDILYFKCLAQADTLHVFINHWPSRRGGQFQSESKRLLAANILRLKVDSIQNINKNSKIIITGDFNDSPQDKSLAEVLQAKTDINSAEPTTLYNLSNSYCGKSNGTHKYRDEWACLDQIIVSGNLLVPNTLHTNPSGAKVLSQSFLLEEDTKYHGNKPFRTYIGIKYNGGFSDHLPVYLELQSEVLFINNPHF